MNKLALLFVATATLIPLLAKDLSSNDCLLALQKTQKAHKEIELLEGSAALHALIPAYFIPARHSYLHGRSTSQMGLPGFFLEFNFEEDTVHSIEPNVPPTTTLSVSRQKLNGEGNSWYYSGERDRLNAMQEFLKTNRSGHSKVLSRLSAEQLAALRLVANHDPDNSVRAYVQKAFHSSDLPFGELKENINLDGVIVADNPEVIHDREKFAVLEQNPVLRKLIPVYFEPSYLDYYAPRFGRIEYPLEQPTTTLYSSPIRVRYLQESPEYSWEPKFDVKYITYDGEQDRYRALKNVLKPAWLTGRSKILGNLSSSELDAIKLIGLYDPSPRIRHLVSRGLGF